METEKKKNALDLIALNVGDEAQRMLCDALILFLFSQKTLFSLHPLNSITYNSEFTLEALRFDLHFQICVFVFPATKQYQD